MNAAEELEAVIAHALEAAGPATVGIRSGRGIGSGIVVSEHMVLTNAHNLRSEQVEVAFARDDVRPGELVAADEDADLAVVGVDTGDITAIAWRPADSGPPVGTVVVALTNPGGGGLRATWGTVSAVERSFRGPRGRRISGNLEHTAPLPRGSSGGPAVDRQGRFVGVNTHRLGDGFYLAIPADAALRDHISTLQSGRPPQRRRLGVAIAPAGVAQRLRAAVGLPAHEGLLVHSVGEGSVAAAAGMARGDLLVAAGETALTRVDDLHRVLDESAPGSSVEFTIVRGVDEMTVTVAFT